MTLPFLFVLSVPPLSDEVTDLWSAALEGIDPSRYLVTTFFGYVGGQCIGIFNFTQSKVLSLHTRGRGAKIRVSNWLGQKVDRRIFQVCFVVKKLEYFYDRALVQSATKSELKYLHPYKRWARAKGF